MQSAKTKLMAKVSVLIASVLLSGGVFANSLSEARAICNDMSAANRNMAKAAGYDVDRLCSSLDSFDTQVPLVNAASLPAAPRDTVSSSQQELSQDQGLNQQSFFNVDAKLQEELKPFGYDIFANMPGTFAAPTNIAVSSNYLLGPGDEFSIILYGKLNQSSTIEINRDGYVDFPELGPVVVAGLTFSEAKNMLQAQIESQVIGTKANISMGALRSMQIFVLGEAFKPGAYSVSSLSTVTQALISAGGVSDIASLRNIQLKRSGKVISNLDLYDLLLSGEVKDDIRLQAADVIFIPTVGNTVSVEGEIIRPAIYELKGEKTVQEIIGLAGGLSPKAFAKSASVERVGDDGFMTVISMDLSSKKGMRTKIKSGDRLTIKSVVEEKNNTVSIDGFIHHPAEYQWREGLTLAELVYSKNQFPSQLDLNYALIAREAEHLGKLSVISFRPGDLFTKKPETMGIELYPRDKIFFFSRVEKLEEKEEENNTKSLMGLLGYKVDKEASKTLSREELISPLLSRLESEASLGMPAKILEIKGAVKFPGLYPLTPNMTVAQMVEAAGGLKDSAYTGAVEISRKNNSNPEESTVDTVTADVAGELILQAQDSIFVKTTPDYLKKDTVRLMGEVVFPGEYSFSKGERLSSVIERAGGFTNVADVNAAIFTREKLKQREQKELDRLKEKLDEELSNQKLVDANSGDKIDAKQQQIQNELIDNLNAAKATGRLVIPLESIIDGKAEDVILEPGDVLGVPQFRQEVSVIGEVQRPTSYFFDKRLNYKDYIEQSGGLTQTANSKGIYIVKASGEVVVLKGKFLAAKRASTKIQPGDTIVVPLDTDDKRFEGVKLFSEITQIIYQLSLGVVAIDSLKD
jgi:protein involved in polysaccharide export with SLBB domain